MIGIVDYGVGNLKNVETAVKRLGRDCFISSDKEQLKHSEALILPGVGAFGDSIDMLNKSGLRNFVDKWVSEDKYLFGICIGMQLLFERSYEMGIHEGLGYLKGEVVPFEKPLTIPHMGWNQLDIVKQVPIVNNIQPKEYVYFVHSYYAMPVKDDLVASTHYGADVAAIVQKDKIIGTQFHPEKSAVTGEKILKNYLELTDDIIPSN